MKINLTNLLSFVQFGSTILESSAYLQGMRSSFCRQLVMMLFIWLQPIPLVLLPTSQGCIYCTAQIGVWPERPSRLVWGFQATGRCTRSCFLHPCYRKVVTAEWRAMLWCPMPFPNRGWAALINLFGIWWCIDLSIIPLCGFLHTANQRKL